MLVLQRQEGGIVGLLDVCLKQKDRGMNEDRT